MERRPPVAPPPPRVGLATTVAAPPSAANRWRRTGPLEPQRRASNRTKHMLTVERPPRRQRALPSRQRAWRFDTVRRRNLKAGGRSFEAVSARDLLEPTFRSLLLRPVVARRSGRRLAPSRAHRPRCEDSLPHRALQLRASRQGIITRLLVPIPERGARNGEVIATLFHEFARDRSAWQVYRSRFHSESRTPAR